MTCYLSIFLIFLGFAIFLPLEKLVRGASYSRLAVGVLVAVAVLAAVCYPLTPKARVRRSQTDFMEDTNAALAEVVGKHDNAELIDWYGYSGTLGEDVFDGDGTHPTIDGCRTYAQMITDAVSSYMPKHAKDEKTRDERFEEAKAAAPECKKRVTDFVHGVLA